MVVIRRDRKTSVSDLIDALYKFIELLKQQKDLEAAQELSESVKLLEKNSSDLSECKKIASNILKTFKDQELDVYLQAKIDYKEWKASDELLELSSRVLNLVKRLV